MSKGIVAYVPLPNEPDKSGRLIVHCSIAELYRVLQSYVDEMNTHAKIVGIKAEIELDYKLDSMQLLLGLRGTDV